MEFNSFSNCNEKKWIKIKSCNKSRCASTVMTINCIYRHSTNHFEDFFYLLVFISPAFGMNMIKFYFPSLLSFSAWNLNILVCWTTFSPFFQFSGIFGFSDIHIILQSKIKLLNWAAKQKTYCDKIKSHQIPRSSLHVDYELFLWDLVFVWMLICMLNIKIKI